MAAGCLSGTGHSVPVSPFIGLPPYQMRAGDGGRHTDGISMQMPAPIYFNLWSSLRGSPAPLVQKVPPARLGFSHIQFGPSHKLLQKLNVGWRLPSQIAAHSPMLRSGTRTVAIQDRRQPQAFCKSMLRGLSFACFAFNGLQAVFISYFVTYPTTLSYNLVTAGALFSTVIAIAIPCRILWGRVGSFHICATAGDVRIGIRHGGKRHTDRHPHGDMAHARHRNGRWRTECKGDVLARHPVV